MHVVVLGGGSLGSLLAGRLASAGPTTVIDHDRSHVDAIRSVGLAITQPDGTVETVRDIEATTDPDEVRSPDLVLLCVKSYDTRTAMTEAASTFLDDALPVLTLQNGLGNAEAIGEVVAQDNVYAGTTDHGAKLEVPGRVRHTGPGRVTIGRYFGPNDARLERIATRFRDSGLTVDVTETIRDSIWEKLLINAGINAPTALARVANGALLDSEAGLEVLSSAVREGLRVAEADGRSLDEDHVLARAERVAERTGSNHSSMWGDLETGSRTEIGAINGAIVDRGEAHGIAVPVNITLRNLVMLAESQLRTD